MEANIIPQERKLIIAQYVKRIFQGIDQQLCSMNNQKLILITRNLQLKEANEVQIIFHREFNQVNNKE
jgi:hypothetical protein